MSNLAALRSLGVEIVLAPNNQVRLNGEDKGIKNDLLTFIDFTLSLINQQSMVKNLLFYLSRSTHHDASENGAILETNALINNSFSPKPQLIQWGYLLIIVQKYETGQYTV